MLDKTAHLLRTRVLIALVAVLAIIGHDVTMAAPFPAARADAAPMTAGSPHHRAHSANGTESTGAPSPFGQATSMFHRDHCGAGGARLSEPSRVLARNDSGVPVHQAMHPSEEPTAAPSKTAPASRSPSVMRALLQVYRI